MPSGTYLNLIIIIKNAITLLEKKEKRKRKIPPRLLLTHVLHFHLPHPLIHSHSSNASKNPTATTHISGEYKKRVKICSVKMELVIRISRIWIVLPKMGEREGEGERREEEEEGGREG